MNPAVALGLGALLLFFAVSRGGKERYKRALVVGDSHSLPGGVGVRLGEMLRSKGFTANVVSKPGRGTMYYMGQALPSRKPVRPSPITRAIRENGNPDLLVVVLGTNDATMLLPPGHPNEKHNQGALAPRVARYKAGLKTFVDMAKAAGVKKIIWFGPSRIEDDPRGQRPDSGHGAWLNPSALHVDRLQRSVLVPEGVEWHSSQVLTGDLPTKDGIHFRGPEYAMWSARAAKLLFDGIEAAAV